MRFSIVIPVYNVEEYLQTCIDSILENDFSDYEIILVDDGSTDGISPALCDEIAERNPELIRVIHQTNQGPSGARNTGVEAAQGEYILFVDSDDSIEPHALKKISSVIDKSKADIVAFNLFSDDGKGALSPIKANSVLADEPFSLRQRPEFLLSLPSIWSRAWKRDLFIKSGIRFPGNIWIGEDMCTGTKLFALAESIVTIDDCLYRYLQRPNSIMSSEKMDRNRSILAAFENMTAWFEAKGLLEVYRGELTRLAIDHILLAATVRVARLDPKHPLLAELTGYMETHFPDFRTNPYITQLPMLHKLLLKLIDGKQYRMVRFLFRIKGGN